MRPTHDHGMTLVGTRLMAVGPLDGAAANPELRSGDTCQ